MNQTIPKDPVLLLSFVNMKLRDYYSSLDDMCASLGIDQNTLIRSLSQIDYEYNAEKNQFI